MNNLLPDIVASTVVLSLLLFVFIAPSVPATWFGLYAFIVTMSATKLYGKKIYDAVKNVGTGLLRVNQKQR